MIIYKTTNLINQKFYIGKDTHNNPNYYGSGKKLKLAIKKYGLENFKKEILETCSSLEELNTREKFWISELNAVDDGYNLTEGGTGGDTWSHNATRRDIHPNLGRTPWNKDKTNVYSQETRNKISKTKKNFYEEHPEKRINKGSFLSGENHREFGKNQTKNRVDKRVNTLTSLGVYSKLKDRMKGNTHAKQRAIKQFNLDGDFINEYNSVTEAANAIGIPRHRIYFFLRGKQSQAAGYIFRYKE
jgi:group I intron endonuclease